MHGSRVHIIRLHTLHRCNMPPRHGGGPCNYVNRSDGGGAAADALFYSVVVFYYCYYIFFSRMI